MKEKLSIEGRYSYVVGEARYGSAHPFAECQAHSSREEFSILLHHQSHTALLILHK